MIRLVESPLPKHIRAWTLEELRLLRELASRGTAAAEIARQLRRTVGAVYRRASLHGIRIAAAGLVALLVLAGPALAELKVGVVNVARLLEEAPQAKVATRALEDEFRPRQREIEDRQRELKAREEKFSKESAVMAEAERWKAERELVNSQRDLQRQQNAFVEDLNARRNETLGRLQGALLAQVQGYAQAQGFDLVVGDGVLFAREGLDVTGALLGYLQTRSKDAGKKP